MKPNICHTISVLILFGMLSCNKTSTENDIAPSTNKSDKDFPENVMYHESHEARKAGAPFSDVVQVGKTFYLSGQIGMDHSVRELVEGGIETETHQTIKNIKEVLEQHNMSLNNVVKCLVILDDIKDFSAFNTVYQSYFPQKPARTTFAAEALARNAKIEIEVVAVKQ